MAKDEEKKPEVMKRPIYILGYKEGRRLFHAEYHSLEHTMDRCLLLAKRKIEFRVEYREMTNEEVEYYETL